MKKRVINILALALSLCLVFGLFAFSLATGDTPVTTEKIWERARQGRAAVLKEQSGLAHASSYAEVYEKVSALYGGGAMSGGGGMGRGDIAIDMVEDAFAPEAPQSAESAPTAAPAVDSDSGGDYSQTNAQVAGIDEGDIVKTDGRYIYILRGYELIVLEAAGASTRELSRTVVGMSVQEKGEDDYRGTDKYPQEMYVLGDRLAVLSGYSSYHDRATPPSDWLYDYETYLCVDIYDITNPNRPTLKESLGQDGSLLSSRLKDGRVYVVSNHYIYDAVENDPGSFVPSLYRGGVATPIAAADICIMPIVQRASYTVVTVYDMADAAITASESMLGGGSTVYMSHDSLYVADTVWTTQESEPYTDGIYTVVSYESGSETNITRFDIDGGLRLTANGTVPGYLHNQFSMDEYDGYLRLVTTENRSVYQVYTDAARGWSNYEWGEDRNDNALYILDEVLTVTGSVTGLAPDETIYSARFSGDIGYFVTFRQVDPLFAVDLSDPAAPRVLSALKIPGFSDYLHLWTGDRLFGLGRDADEQTGRTGSMKLSMFNTENPADVTELRTLILQESYSVALYNHKAILIDQAKNLIGFPVESGYLLYSYTDGGGFVQKARINIDYWSGDSRGLYIGDCYYVISDNGVSILDLTTFRLLATLAF